MADPKQSKLRLKDRRQRLAWVKVAAGSGVIALSLALVWYAVRLPGITITNVEVSGAIGTSTDAVKGVALAKLAGSYFFFVPHANVFVFPKDSITAAIANAFPDVAAVSVTRTGLNTLAISVAPRVPVALWCAGIPADALSACYLMDKNGSVFAATDNPQPFIRFYGLIHDAPVGASYLPDDFASLKPFVEEISSTAHRTPKSVLIEDNGDVSIGFTEGGVLKFVRTDGHETLLDNIASVFASHDLAKSETLDYADFRFGDKVYVKFVEK